MFPGRTAMNTMVILKLHLHGYKIAATAPVITPLPQPHRKSKRKTISLCLLLFAKKETSPQNWAEVSQCPDSSWKRGWESEPRSIFNPENVRQALQARKWEQSYDC